MDLSDKEIAHIKEAVEARVRHFHTIQFGRGEGYFEAYVGMMADTFSGYGTGEYEKALSKEAIADFVRIEWEQIPDGLNVDIQDVFVQVSESNVADVMCDMTVSNPLTPDQPGLGARITSTWVLIKGQWMATQLHASVPWDAQADGDPYPMDELKARAEKLEAEVAQRTEELSRANRELAVDAAIERIRRVSAGMIDPSDLVEVVKQIRVEVGALYGDRVVEVGLIQEADDDTFKFWSVFDIKDVPEDLALFGMLYPQKPDPPHPMLDRVWGVEGAYSLLYFDLDDLWRIQASLERYSPEEADGLRIFLESGEIEGGWQTVSSIQVGRMYLGWFQEPPEELASVQPRIAAVLSEAQKRVEELQKANLRALEAKVEAAVERVRSRALAMQTSKELTEVAVEILQQMMQLDVVPMTATSISLEIEPGLIRHVDVTAPNPENPDEVGLMDFEFELSSMEPPNFFLEEWRLQGAYWTNHAFGDNLSNSIDWLSQYQSEQAAQYRAAFEEGHFAEFWQGVVPITDGRLSVGLFKPAPPELEWILPKFGKAFDLAYGRFQDLEKAEAQTREAEINLAVEKVRARASGMQTSGEIVDVADVLREQLVQLGLSDVMACTVYTRTPDGQHRVTEMARLEEGSSELSFDWVFDPAELNPDVMVHDFLAAETTTVFHEDTEAMALLLKEALKFDPDYVEDYEQAVNESGISEVWVAVHPAESIRLCIDFKTEPPEEILTILPRMARAFDHAYRRHQDLERAEAQAREAQIEAALERVRGRALAMKTSEEMIDVADELRRQMGLLGQAAMEACAIHVYDVEGDDFESWGAIRDPDRGDEAISNEIRLFPRKGVSILEKSIEGYESEKDQYVLVPSGDEWSEFFEMLKERAPEPYEALLKQLPEGMTPADMQAQLSYADFSGGSIALMTNEAPGDDLLVLLSRSARVFDLAYRRFRDLRETEIAEREAQIEAALERIRRASGEMTEPSDLTEVVKQIKRELDGLYGNDVWETSLMMEEDEDTFRFWSIQDADEAPDTLEQFGVLFPKVSDPPHPMIDRWWNADGEYTVFSNDLEDAWKVHASLSVYLPREAELVKAVLDSGTVEESWHTVSSIRNGRMYLIWGPKPPKEVANVQPRMAAVLSEAQKRAEELQRAQEMTREAQIETALERVRGRAMAMRSSGELNEVADELRRQMAILGQTELEVCTIHIYDVEGDDFESWGVINDPSQEGPVETEVRLFPRKGVPILEEIIAAYESEENNHVFLNDGEKAAGFFRMLKERHPDVLERLMALIPPGLKPADMKAWWSFSDFSGGSLGIVTYKPADPESLDLLERTAKVFDLAYRRFKDLREAEEAARESQIETALERVRSRSLAMQSSDELMDVAQVLFQQLIVLGLNPDDVETCGFVVFREGSRIGDTFLTQPDGSPMAYTFSAEYGGNRATSEHYEAWENGAPIHMVTLEGQELPDHLDYLAQSSDKPVDRFHEMAGKEVPSVSYNYSANFKHGYVAVITTQPQENAEALYPRFAKVFEQAYTRFLDLKKAEAAAREARIESALEKVRSRTMGMQTGEELKDVVVLLYNELIALGITDFVTCGYVEIHEDKQIQDTWVTSPGGDTFGLFYLPLQGDATFDARYAAWKKQEPIFHQTVAGQERSDHLEYAITKFNSKEAEEMVRSQFPDPTVFYCFNFSHGYLHLVGGSLLEKEEELLIARFTKVFEQTYTRFLDLKKAEAQARESQIEAALERVRAVATAMRNSNELLSVMQHIHKEFSGLGFPCGAFWNARYLDTHYEKAVTDMDGSQVTAIMELPRDFSMIPELAAWERGTEKLGVFQFGTEASIEYLNHMINKGKFLEIVPGVLTEELLREKGGWTFVQARTTHGELGYNLWGEADPSQEATDTLLRFAAVFDLAYRRFVDLEEAEHQAREAQINLAVEKVRARAMAMHGSEEMAEVAETLRDQLQELGVEGVSSSTVYTEQGGGRYRIWDMADIQGVEDSAVTLDFTFHPEDAAGELYFKDILGADGYSSFHYQGERLQAISDWLRDYDQVSSDTMDRLIKDEDLTDLWISSYPVQRGFLSVDTVVPPSEELAVILPRMASAFDLAYRRFEDLQEAEAATREAQIDAALERVRGQAMAMQKPEDISDVSIRMFDELEGLGIVSLRSGISIPGEGERYIFHAATKDEDGATTLVLGDESVDVHPIIRRAYQGWKSQESFQSTVLEGKDLVAYYHAVFDTMPLPDWKERMQRGEAATESFATFPFQDGWLYTFARHAFEDAELDLYQRFARVFGLAYQRYHDLTKAERDYQALLEEKARTEKALSDLQATQKQLVEQEKLASLGSLTAGIAHEIKNPLNFVNNFAEVSTELMEELAEAVAKGDTEEAAMILGDLRDNAEQIAKHGKRADSIVRSMMQHARGGASEMETIVVNEFLEEYANLSWHGMRARDHGFSADIERSFDPNAGELQVMPQELGRVVLNLINNAFDAVKAQDDGLVTIASERSDNALIIRVSDNGPGIPEEIRQKIFEPFFTTKATGEGTGLGLSLSYDIVTKGHGGTMTVGAADEGGALFTITLPSVNA